MEKTKHRRTRPRRSRLTRAQKVLLTVAVLLAVAVAVTAAYKKLFIQPELPQEDAAAQIDWGDGIQPKVEFDTTGTITTDVTPPVESKNFLGTDYGMSKASAIGKEWNEQAAAFAAYTVGKTADEVTGIAVSETGGAADADLAASCSIAIGGFQSVVAKAAK